MVFKFCWDIVYLVQNLYRALRVFVYYLSFVFPFVNLFQPVFIADISAVRKKVFFRQGISLGNIWECSCKTHLCKILFFFFMLQKVFFFLYQSLVRTPHHTSELSFSTAKVLVVPGGSLLFLIFSVLEYVLIPDLACCHFIFFIFVVLSFCLVLKNSVYKELLFSLY